MNKITRQGLARGCMILVLALCYLCAPACAKSSEKQIPEQSKSYKTGTALETKGNNPSDESERVIDCATLLKECKTNPSEAERKYKGKTVHIKGRVSGLSRDLGYSTSAVFVSPTTNSIDCIFCYFFGKHREEVANLKKGDTVEVQGVVIDAVGDPMMNFCQIVTKK